MKALRNSKGFTLIELLVVVAIIGILAAIAIPQFAEYRKRGFDARAVSDLRNIATAQEAYFVTYSAYSSNCATLPGFKQSADVTISSCTGTATDFVASTTSPKGTTGKTFTWNSANGGLQP